MSTKAEQCEWGRAGAGPGSVRGEGSGAGGAVPPMALPRCRRPPAAPAGQRCPGSPCRGLRRPPAGGAGGGGCRRSGSFCRSRRRCWWPQPPELRAVRSASSGRQRQRRGADGKMRGRGGQLVLRPPASPPAPRRERSSLPCVPALPRVPKDADTCESRGDARLATLQVVLQ